MNRKQAALFIAIVTFIAVFTVVYFLDAAEQTRQKAQLHQSVLEKLTTLKVTLEKSVNAKVMLTQGIIAYVGINPDMTQEAFRRYAIELFRTNNSDELLVIQKSSMA